MNTIYADTNVGRSDIKKATNDEMLAVTSIFTTFQGEMPFAGRPAIFLRLAGCNRGNKNTSCSFCFPDGTNISTPKGNKKLSDLAMGDKLFTLGKNGKLTTTKIKKIVSRWVKRSDLVQITYQMPDRKNIQSVICTKEHPFEVVGKGFVEARYLQSDEEIYHVSGNEILKWKMRNNNPMKNPKIAQKVGKIVKKKYENGEIIPYIRSKQLRKLHSRRMIKNNPMYNDSSKMSMLKNKIYKKSTLEKRVHMLLKQLDIPVKYTGNRQFFIGDENEVKRPDFKLGKNKVIETYDPTFKLYKEGLRNKENYEIPTRKFYKKYGYKVLFIKPRDLGGQGSGKSRDLSHLENKVNTFIHNGAKVIEVKKVNKKMFGQMKRKNTVKRDKVKVINFTCSPHHTFVIGGLHTHNCDTDFRWENKTICEINKVTRTLENALYAHNTRLVVITGGEPLLQAPALELLIARMKETMVFQIESNGDFDIPDKSDSVWKYPHIVISPKSYESPMLKIKQAFSGLKLERLMNADSIRFLISGDENSPYYYPPQPVIDAGKQGIPIYLSPITVYSAHGKKSQAERDRGFWGRGIKRLDTRRNYQRAVEVATSLLQEHKLDVGLSTQSHLMFGVE